MNNLTEYTNNLIENGYKEFNIESVKLLYKNCDRFFQKRIRDAEETKYFVNLYVYDFAQYNGNSAFLGGKFRTSFEICFYDNNITNTLTLCGEDFSSIAAIEKYIEDFFIRNNYINDIYNN